MFGFENTRHFILVPSSPMKNYLTLSKHRNYVPLGVNIINLNAATRLPFSWDVFLAKKNLTCYLTIYDPKQHVLSTISQSYSGLYKMDQVLDHPL